MRDGIGLGSDRGPILLAMLVAQALVALDATVLATAVPSIVRDLGGFSSFPWLFSIYLLTSAVTVPLYSKIADTVGRKPGAAGGHSHLPPRVNPLRIRVGHAVPDRLPGGI